MSLKIYQTFHARCKDACDCMSRGQTGLLGTKCERILDKTWTRQHLQLMYEGPGAGARAAAPPAADSSSGGGSGVDVVVVVAV